MNWSPSSSITLICFSLLQIVLTIFSLTRICKPFQLFIFRSDLTNCPAMKLLYLIPLSIILYACPYESSVGLEPGPVEAVDSSLLGYWYGIIKDGSDFFGIEALDISRQSDSLYAITRYGKTIRGDMIVPDTARFTGFTSRVNDQLFMTIQGSVLQVITGKKKRPEVKTQKIFYLSNLQRRGDTLTVKTITDNFSPLARKGFRYPGQLKIEISQLLEQKKNIFDDTYSLSYRKMPHPTNLQTR